MRRIAAVLVLLASLGAAPARAGLDLNWNACAGPPGASNITLDCSEDGGGIAQLFATFKTPTQVFSFVAMDAVVDLAFAGTEVPPFWHFEAGACNEPGILISDARPIVCPSTSFQTPWGAGGAQADAFITAYAPGFGNATRARMLVTVARSSSAPIPLNTATNYFGFELDVFSDQASFCAGCSTPAEIYWTSATLYSVNLNEPPVVVTGAGTRADFVSVNGGLSTVRLFSLAPTSVHRDDHTSFVATGARLQSSTDLRLVSADGAPDLAATGIQASADGRTLTATVNFTGATSGIRDAVVRNLGGDTDTLRAALQVLGGPVISSVSPRIAVNTGSLTLEVVGNGFDAAAVVKMRRAGHADIIGGPVVVSLQGQHLTARFDMALFDPGLWDLLITNPDASAASLAGALDVRAVTGGPQVTSVVPAVAADSGSARLRALGHGFLPGLTLSLRRPGEPEIVGTGVLVSGGGTEASADFSLGGRARGLWSVVVTGPDSAVGSLPNGFTIDVVPRLIQVSPSFGYVNVDSVVMTITGHDIVPGAQMRLLSPTLPILTAVRNMVSADSGSIVATFLTSGVEPGVRSIDVTNPKGLVGLLPAAFELRAGPFLRGITPPAAPDTGSATITMLVDRVVPGVDVRLTRSGEPDIVGGNLTLSAARDTLRARFDLSLRAVGAWSVRLTNPDASLGVFPQAFSVLRAPRPQSVSPDSAGDGGPATITIAGTGFESPTASLRHIATGTVLGATGTTPDSGEVHATFALLDAPQGSYDVRVTNSNGVTGVLPAAFRVVPAIRLRGITPASAPDTGAVTVTMLVGNVLPGVDVRLKLSGQTDIVGSNVTLSAARDTLRARFNLALRTADVWDLRLTNPNGDFGVFVRVFTVLPSPRPQSVNPDSVGADSPVTIMITGTGFQGPVASLRHVATGTVRNATSTTLVGGVVNATFNLLAASFGSYDVRVTNSSGLTGTLPAALFVVPGLQLLAVEPSAAETGTQATLHLTGNGMVPGATVAMGVHGFGFPLSAYNVVVDPNGESLTATFNLTGVLAGIRDIAVQNPDGASKVLVGRFAVLGLPLVTAVTPSKVSTPAPVNVLISGRVFLPGATPRLVRPGEPNIPGQNVFVMPDSTRIQCTFDLTGQTFGFWDVVVTNPSGNSGTRANGMLLYVPPQTFNQGLDLTWGGCNVADPDNAENVDIECGNPDFTATLVGNFQPPVDFKDLSAMDAVFTIDFKAIQVPPFWYANQGGCNQGLFSISALRPANCPASQTENPWGASPEAFITAYGYGSAIGFPPDRARMLLTVVRPTPFQLEGGHNYLGFQLTLSNTNENGCAGCETQVDINWSGGVLYSSSSIQSPMTLIGPGLRRANVTVNIQRRPEFFASSMTPTALSQRNSLGITILGSGIQAGATAQLVRPGETSIPMRDIVTTANGETLRAVVDLVSAALGTWGFEVHNPGGDVSLVLDAIQVELDTAGNPTALVLSPNGNERLIVGSDYDVSWESNDDVAVTGVDLYLSRSGPSGPFELVALGLPPAGTYRWRATRPLSGYCYFRAVARDASGRSGTDTSNYPFSIEEFPTPTRLLTFDADARDDGIELRWAFATPSEFATVVVQRAQAASDAWEDLALHVTSDGDVMRALDASVVPGRSYQYRLRATTSSGATQMFGPITATAPAAVASEPLTIAVSPNPSRGPVDVAFSLPRPGTARIAIVDLMGREVAAATVTASTAGLQRWTWNGSIGLGLAPAGVYFARIETAQRAWVRRFVLAR